MASDRETLFPPFPPINLHALDPSDLLENLKLPNSQDDDAFLHPSPVERQSQRLQPFPRYLVGISSKAYFSHAQTIDYVRRLLQLPPTPPSQLRLFFIPSFPGVSTSSLLIQQAIHRSSSSSASPASSPFNLLLGAQECHFAPAGAHTGSVPATELAELGCTLVELGHAERRRPPLCESNAMIGAKARLAVAAGLVPLVCIGEQTRPTDVAAAMREMRPQLDAILNAVGSDAHIVLGYEPVWAIGQSEPAPADYVCQVVDQIRKVVQGHTGQVRILYGGSAKPGIWQQLKGSVDGLFLGRFAHKIESLKEVIQEVLQDVPEKEC